MSIALVNSTYKYSEKHFNGFYHIGYDKRFSDLGGSSIFYNPNKKHFMAGSKDTWGNCKAFAYWDSEIILNEDTMAGRELADKTHKNKKEIEKLLTSIPHERRGNDYIYLNTHYRNVSKELFPQENEWNIDVSKVWREKYPIIEKIEKLTQLTFSERTIAYPCPE